ncbi:Brix domain-containing protein 2, partial [Perkinsus marinus ATCC 50983]
MTDSSKEDNHPELHHHHEEVEEEVNKDPYYLEEAEYIKTEHRWRNRQRVLVFGSRGITSRYRHLLEDIKRICVHSKSEPKVEKKQRLQDIKEICELKSCNNCIYMECRKSQYCYMWMGCMPNGPTAKFQIHNVHTLGEMKLTGNCLRGSRPLLHFDAAFDNTTTPQLMLYKQMFIKMFGIPRNHPKSKPFYDHVMAFYWLDNKIWI